MAQWIEHQTSNLGVAGSSPAEGTTFTRKGGVAQMVERVLCMHEAQGSIPCSSNFYFLVFYAGSQNMGMKVTGLTLGHVRVV